MQNKLNELVGKTFEYDLKVHYCRSSKIVGSNAVIFTDRQTFNFYPNEFNDFLEKIVLKPNLEQKNDFGEVVHKINNNEIALKKQDEKTLIETSVIRNFQINEQITGKLFDIFNELESNPSDELLKKANAMVMASNAIVSVQASQFKLMNIRK